MRGDLFIERVQPHAQILRLAFSVLDPLLDRAALLHLRRQRPALPLGFNVEIRQPLALAGQPLFDLIAGKLLVFVRFLKRRHLFAQRPQFARGQVQFDRRLRGIALEQPVLAREGHAQLGFQLRFEFVVALRLRSLPLQRIHLPPDLFEDVVYARQVLLGAFELRLRQPLPGFELGDAGRFLNDRAPVLRLRAQNLPDAALFDDRVALRTQAGSHEEILDVAKAGHPAVDEVLALPRSIQSTGNRDLGGLLRQRRGALSVRHDLRPCRHTGRAFFVDVRVHQSHGHVRHADRLAVAGACKNHVFHARAAQRLRTLFAQHPTNGVADVRLPAAVGPDDARNPLTRETKLGPIAERLEALEFYAS